jgi:hypothetical protein
MNDNLILSEVAATLTAHYSALAAAVPRILHAQAAADTARPVLTVSGEFKPYRGTIRKGTLALELRSRIGDETEGQHQERFDFLFAAMLGTGAFAAFKAFISARGKIDVRLIAPAEENIIVSEVEGDDLVTTLNLHFIAEFLPQV